METVIAIIIPAAMALFLSLLLCPAAARLSTVIGAIDMPDGNRKINSKPMARLGGVGFFIAFFTAAALTFDLGDQYIFTLLAGGAIIVASGVADDTHSLPPIVKLILQFAVAALAVISLGAPRDFSFLGLFSIPLPLPLGFLIALVRIVFSINAVNFTDGLDGLATGISLVALFSICLFALTLGNLSVSAAAAVLAASLLGFLPYNRHPARMYMGDSGSQFLGFSIAVLALGARGGGNFAAETLFFLIIPVIDTWFSVVRRLIKRKNPFSADKGHLHHILLNRGYSHSAAVKILVCISGISAAATLLVARR